MIAVSEFSLPTSFFLPSLWGWMVLTQWVLSCICHFEIHLFYMAMEIAWNLVLNMLLKFTLIISLDIALQLAVMDFLKSDLQKEKELL